MKQVKTFHSELVSSKASRNDKIGWTELKVATDQITPAIALIFHKSLMTGKLTNKIKVANLFPC